MQQPTKDLTLTDLVLDAAVSGCLTAIAIWSRMKAIQHSAGTRVLTPHFLSRPGKQP